MFLTIPKRNLPGRFLLFTLGASLMLSAPMVNAQRAYLGTWGGIYPSSTSDTTAGCALCHLTTSGSGYNPYGDDILNSNAGAIEDRIADVENLDSDQDPTGSDNITEINANTQPGWTGSAPFTGELDPASNVPPIADAGGPYSGIVDVDVIFDGRGSNDSDGLIQSYFWEFGDGATGSGPMPGHAYLDAGNYIVTLTVTDDAGDSDSATTNAEIGLANVPPVANAGGPYAGTIDIPLGFDGSGSTDTDGTIVSYDWDFGDGSTGSTANPSHTYTEAGEFTVTLLVTDDAGDTGEDSTTATIGLGNLPPVADVGGPYSGTVGLSVAFDGTGSIDPDGTIVFYDWDMGDGTVLMDAGPTPTYTYTTASTYNVTLTVTDDAGVSDSAATTATIVEANQPPLANAGGPYNGTENIALNFDGSGSSDPDGTIVSYEWDFGDGTNGTGVSPSHTYASAGSYLVSLVVTDDAGDMSVDTTNAEIGVANIAPTANANGPYTGIVDVDVVFDGTGSSDSDGTIVSYEWDFGDGATGTGPMPAHAYTAEGTYDVILTVTDDWGDMGTDQTSATISLVNQAPVANANGPYTGTVDIALNFSSAGSTDPDGTIVSYAWDFGDGSSSSLANPSYTYAVAGTYEVSLVVMDDEGATGSDMTTATIGVGNLPPTADAGGPYSGIVDVPVDFDGSGSSDPDGVITFYDWDFGDGTVLMDGGANPSHTYTVAGTFNVTLTVTDDSDVSDSAVSTATIEVAPNQLPTADAGGPYAGTEGVAVSFDGSGSSDPDGTIVSYTWDFGDGSSGTGATPSHVYAVAGSYTVGLTVTDDVGASASATTTATIEAVPNELPTADAGGPYTGTEGVAVSFDGTGSSDPDGSIVSYAWDFGDGSNGTGATPSYVYATAGNYTVTLTVTDDAGATDSATATATIEAVANVPPTADAGGPYTGTEGVAVSFDGTGSSDPDGSIVSYAWDFGDGNTGTGSTPSHSYASAGTYTVTLTVTDDEGATDSDGTTATIETATTDNLPPVADSGGPYSGIVGIPVEFDGSGSSDPEGSDLTYHWNFGDGSTGTGVSVLHNYVESGRYYVTLTVIDEAGASDSETTTAYIQPAEEDRDREDDEEHEDDEDDEVDERDGDREYDRRD